TINDQEPPVVPWSARVRIPAEEFADPDFDWSLGAYCFATSLPEHRPTRDTHGEDGIFPVFGLSADHRAKIRYDGLKTSADFVKACTDAGGHTEIVVYLHISQSGGRPAFSF